LRFPSEKWSSVNKQQKMYENKSWTVQEVHDGKAFERGVSYAASVRRHTQAPFPLQLSDPPGTISRAIQTVRVPAPPFAPRTSSMPTMDWELETFRKTNLQGKSRNFYHFSFMRI
jgi:hypothetical protein